MSKDYREDECTIVIVDDEPMITQSIISFCLNQNTMLKLLTTQMKP